MDKIDKRYENGKIYTIKCKYDNKLIYVGSTIQKLCYRIEQHKKHKTCSLYQHVSGDWDNWYIELYEEYSCNNRTILEKREGEIIRLIGTINKCIAGRTDKEWRVDNKERLAEYDKMSYRKNKDKNKDKRKEYNKKYYNDNRDKLIEQVKKYDNDNRDKIKEKVECDKCKSIVSRKSLTRHKRTKKCLNYNVNNK